MIKLLLLLLLVISCSKNNEVIMYEYPIVFKYEINIDMLRYRPMFNMMRTNYLEHDTCYYSNGIPLDCNVYYRMRMFHGEKLIAYGREEIL